MKANLTILFSCFMFLLSANALAQKQTVSGTVTDQNDGMPLPGVSVIEKGTTNGTATNFDGFYSLEVDPGSVLVFSMVGFQTKEINVGQQEELNVELVQDVSALDEVVITALGIKREKKSLGYALQEVQGESLVEARENNLANAFTGKVAGLQIVRGSNGPASSSKIVLRGNNSLTGDNQPLIVVDGVPMDNFTGASNNDFWNPSPDMGSGLGDLNPENIESMSVLKGASAAALYGSRAGNGVILITTKTGSAQEGLGITYSSSIGFEEIFMDPDMQSVFGQGSNGVYDPESTLSWGPRIEGQTVTDWKGDQVQLQAYDNLEGYFDTGVNVTQSLSFSQQINSTSVYSSITYLDDDSMIPGSSLNRTNLMTRAVTKFGPDDKWGTDFKVQYINSTANNRPLSGVNQSNAFYTMYLLPRTVDVTDFSAAVDEFGNHFWYIPASNALNPYWGAKYINNEDSRDRFLLNGSVSYEFTDWLQAEIRGGSDQYTTNTESKTYGGSPLTPTGRYSMGKNTFMENNFSALITAGMDDVFGQVGFSGSLGGNLMHQKSSTISGSAGELEVPNLFSLNNGIGNPSISEGATERKINSIYGTFQVNYDGYFFLDVTGRNDWSSTLSKENRSFFYPSVSTSLVVTDALKSFGSNIPDWITYGKVRGSYAEVGNDLPPYQLYNTYYIGKDPLGNTTAGRNGVLYNPDVKSELIKSWEAGFEGRFLDNRIGIDFSWYKTNATQQLINIPMNPMSGYSAMKVNAGDIENRGIEIMLNGRLIDNPDGFNWSMNLNYSKNENIVNELTDEVETYALGGFDNVSILAVAGQPYGEIWGTKYRRVEDPSSPYFNELIVDSDGMPMATTERYRLGNQQPDALLGWTNTFSYKGLSLSFLLDGRFGGEIFSGTNLSMQRAGTAAVTVVNGQREDFIVDGVVDVTPEGATSPVYEVNSTAVSHQNYWNASASTNLGITEANIYDATNIRLRTVQLNYNLPKKWTDAIAMQRAQIGVSANNVWMIDSNLNGIDPESVFATGTNAVGFENASSPTSRSYYFNLSVSF